MNAYLAQCCNTIYVNSCYTAGNGVLRANGWINQEIIIRGATNKACLNLYYSGGGNVCGDPTCGYLCINPLNYNSGYSNQYYNNNVPNNPFTPFINSLSH